LTTGVFSVLLIAVFLAAVIGLILLAKLETRFAVKATLAPKLLLGLFAGVLGLFYLDGAMVFDRTPETVRQLFHLPDDVEVGRINGGDRQPICFKDSLHRRASVQFTPGQFASYVATVHDHDIWRPVLPPHYDAHNSRLHVAGRALAWQDLPEPRWMGKQQLVWRIANEDVRRGLVLCYNITWGEQHAQNAADAAGTEYVFTPCNARKPGIPPAGGGRVTAALDFDKERLNVALHFDGKAAYCNNRVSNWLGAVRGQE
jgi:hypothetical protein